MFYVWYPQMNDDKPEVFEFDVPVNKLSSPAAVKKWIDEFLTAHIEVGIEELTEGGDVEGLEDNLFIEVADTETHEVYFSEIVKFEWAVNLHVRKDRSKLRTAQRKKTAKWLKEKPYEPSGGQPQRR